MFAVSLLLVFAHSNLQPMPQAAAAPMGRQVIKNARGAPRSVVSPAAAQASLYDELYRPQFHFSAKKNWLNDPNGMVFYQGEYHLCFQFNPTGINWGNMTWGHAVSADLVHWRQLEDAIHPDKLGTIFSGSAVVDWHNTAGFEKGDEKTLVAIYTSAGKPFTQSIAYSNDRGRTWTKYEQNPVLKHIVGGNRDPNVRWHARSKKWVMALYLDQSTFALFNSPDLKQWTKLSEVTLRGSSECPDFFELPIDGDARNSKWVFWGANNHYLLGTFDGTAFRSETEPLRTHWGRNRYAAQTFSDIPATDGRCIQIAWMRGGKYPEMPFNQQMSFPVALDLRTFPDGVRLCTQPVKEIENLRDKHHAWSGALKPGDNPLDGVTGDLFDIRLDIQPQGATEVGLNIRGEPIVYHVAKKKLFCQGAAAPVELAGGRLVLRVLVDRSSIEIFAADGRVNMAHCFLPAAENKTLAVFARGGDAAVRSVEVWNLKSSWGNLQSER